MANRTDTTRLWTIVMCGALCAITLLALPTPSAPERLKAAQLNELNDYASRTGRAALEQSPWVASTPSDAGTTEIEVVEQTRVVATRP